MIIEINEDVWGVMTTICKKSLTENNAIIRLYRLVERYQDGRIVIQKLPVRMVN